MQTLELFAGCGGLAKGLERAGFSHAGLIEFNPQACESLRANFNPRRVHEIDVRKVDFRQFSFVDVVSGGPPCQPFSLGGKARAYNDSRDMFPQAIRAISEIRPKAFLFENVKGLLRAKFAPYFDYIISRLSCPDCPQDAHEDWREHAARLKSVVADGSYSGLRYRVEYRLLNAADYGVPQVRERVFIVGLREDVAEKWQWPEPTCCDHASRVCIREALRGVPDPQSPENDLSDHVYVPGARMYPGHTGSLIDRPSKTVKAGAHGVPGGENMLRFGDGTVRYMTVREAKLIQSFPPDFVVTGTWSEALRQIGNAVPVRLAETVGGQLRKLLERERKRTGARSAPVTEPPTFLSGEQMRMAVGE